MDTLSIFVSYRVQKQAKMFIITIILQKKQLFCGIGKTACLSEAGEQVEDADAHVVAEHVAQESDSDAEDDDVFVAQQGCHHGYEGRRVDE